MKRAMPPRTVWTLMILASIGLGAAVTRQSLWIDEASTVYFASHETLSSLVATLTQFRTSEPQKPFYLLYIWGWAKLFGTSEYALRAANLPLAAVLVMALGWTSWRVLGRPVLWVVFCFSPFIWFYMNEARPYMAILAASAVSTGAFMAYLADREAYRQFAPWLCLSALFIAYGLQMLSAFLAPCLLILAVFAVKNGRLTGKELLRDWAPALWIHVPLFVGLSAYFLWTLSVGAGGMRETPGLSNFAFAVYEFMGFMGLGPPRHLLRADQSLETIAPYWPWLGMGALSTLAFLCVSLGSAFHRRRNEFPGAGDLGVALAGGFALFAIAATAVDFRYWGRHLAQFFPLFSFMVIAAIGASATARTWKIAGRVAVFALASMWIVSIARLWAMPQYQKDDYRYAVRTAVETAHRSDATIVWVANSIAARYYGIEFEEPLKGVQWRGAAKARYAGNWDQQQVREYLNGATRPVVLVLGKVDLYDKPLSWTAAVNKLNPRKIASPNSFNVYLFERESAER